MIVHFFLGSKIWQRYIVYELLKTMFFILCISFLLFALIDFTSRTETHHDHGIRFQISEIAIYYLFELSRQLDVLLPFALMIATIKVLSDLVNHGELITLMMSGLKIKTLMRPIVYLGLVFTACLYINSEFVAPKAERSINQFLYAKKSEGKKRKMTLSVSSLALEDSSRLLFLSYDQLLHRFFDAIWIRSEDEIYRMKYLYPESTAPYGEYVEHLIREKDGHFTVNSSKKTQVFPDFELNPKSLHETIFLPEELSIRELLAKVPSGYKCTNDKECQLMSTLYLKLLMPWLCYFVVIGIIPSCLQFYRGLSLFLIYATATFGFVFYHLFFEATFILAKRQTISPENALLVPFVCLFIFFTIRYNRKCQYI
jgi:lipopolysaccharide export system permease protein